MKCLIWQTMILLFSIGCADLNPNDQDDWVVETWDVQQEGSCETVREVRMNPLASEIEAAGAIEVLELLDEDTYENEGGQTVSYSSVIAKAKKKGIDIEVQYDLQCISDCQPGNDKSTCTAWGCDPTYRSDGPPYCTMLDCKKGSNDSRCKGSCNKVVVATPSTKDK